MAPDMEMPPEGGGGKLVAMRACTVTVGELRNATLGGRDMVKISERSAGVTSIELYFNATKLSVATGFYWRPNQKVYLVTNWHNVTGINPITGRHLSESAAEPNKMRIDAFAGRDPNKRITVDLSLYDGDNKPIWLEHPVYGNRVDVVCVPLPASFRKDCFPFNRMSGANWALAVGQDAYILGYPLGIGPGRWPIWKRASIATEPEIDVEGLPLFYVDSLSARGMSGSPVILYDIQGQTEDKGWTVMDGPCGRLIGVYSGRMLAGSSVDAQLGRVWKARVIDEIINGRRRGKIR